MTILGFLSAGLTHDFGQKMKIFSSFVLGQNGPGNSVLRIFEVENKLSYTVKIWFFIDATLVFFSKGLTNDFGQNMEILSLYVFVQMVLEIMFDDHWGRKQVLFDYKNLAITKSPYWDFFKGVNPRFWLKIGNYLFVCFLAK